MCTGQFELFELLCGTLLHPVQLVRASKKAENKQKIKSTRTLCMSDNVNGEPTSNIFALFQKLGDVIDHCRFNCFDVTEVNSSGLRRSDDLCYDRTGYLAFATALQGDILLV
jgi:hypothetical protein